MAVTPYARMRLDRASSNGVAHAFPVITSPEGWIAKATVYNPQCKTCDPRAQVEVLRWLVLRALAEPYNGERVTIRNIVRWLETERGIKVRFESVKKHLKNHVELVFVKPETALDPVRQRIEKVERELVKVTPEQRTAEIRAEVARRREASTEPDHIAYLQSVVGIAHGVIEANPERVTPEMGLRAAAELSRIKASAERDRMLEILARSAGRPVLPVVEVVGEIGAGGG
jgi:hypothetical protein